MGGLGDIFGKDGIKTDVTVDISNDTYLKLGATAVVTFIIIAVMSILLKQMKQ